MNNETLTTASESSNKKKLATMALAGAIVASPMLETTQAKAVEEIKNDTRGKVEEVNQAVNIDLSRPESKYIAPGVLKLVIGTNEQDLANNEQVKKLYGQFKSFIETNGGGYTDFVIVINEILQGKYDESKTLENNIIYLINCINKKDSGEVPNLLEDNLKSLANTSYKYDGQYKVNEMFPSQDITLPGGKIVKKD